jgi:CheY-like chemotaxis protein
MREKDYDVILMDLRMPEMDGIEATRRIFEEWPEPSRPRIIAMTADVTVDKRNACLEVGMEGFVSKPIDRNELARALERRRDLRERMKEGSAEECTSNRDGRVGELFPSLLRMVGDDHEALLRFLTEFEANCDRLMEDLTEAFAHGDYATVGRIAHTLKSSSAFLDLKELSGRCAALERACDEGGGPSVPDMIEGISRGYDEVRPSIGAYMERLRSAGGPTYGEMAA